MSTNTQEALDRVSPVLTPGFLQKIVGRHRGVLIFGRKVIDDSYIRDHGALISEVNRLRSELARLKKPRQRAKSSRELEIVIPDLKPTPKGRARFAPGKTVNGRFIKGHAYTPAATRGYKTELAWHFRSVCKEPWKGPIDLEVQLYTAGRVMEITC